MTKVKTVFVLLLFTINTVAQDTVGFPETLIKPFLELKSQLNEPVNQFPIIESGELVKKDFDNIKTVASRVKDSLQLLFIKYYSESNKEWNQEYFENHFQIVSVINQNTSLTHDEINFQIDTTRKSSIIENRMPKLDLGIGFLGYDNETRLSKRISYNMLDKIQKEGELTVKIEYLTSYDTIRFNKDSIGKKFQIGNNNYRLDNITNGKIYIRILDSIQDRDSFNDLKHIAFKNQNVIHLPTTNEYPWNFKNEIKIYSGFLNDSLSKLSSSDYEKYLKNLKLDQTKTDLIILNTNLDFDEIMILKPRYEFFIKNLKARVKKENVNHLEVVKHSVPIIEKLQNKKPMQN